jgi:hypothetical protein
MKPVTLKHLLAQEADREHGPFLKGMGRKGRGVVASTGGQPDQPGDCRGQRANEHEDCPAPGVAAAPRLQAQAPPLPFAVTTCLLTLPPHRLQLQEARCGPGRVRQRRGEEPRIFVQLGRACGRCPVPVDSPRAPGATPVLPNQRERTGRGRLARPAAPAHIPGSGGRTGIERGGIAPVRSLGESKVVKSPDSCKKIRRRTRHSSGVGVR